MNLPHFIAMPDPSIYMQDDYVVLDFETTTKTGGASNPVNSIVSCAWQFGPDGPMQFVRGGELNLGALVDDIGKASFIVAHFAKFELAWLERCGISLHEVLPYCTMLGEYVLGGNRWKYNKLGLDSILKRRRMADTKIASISRMIKSGIPVEHIPSSWLEKYNKKDAYVTNLLFQQQRKDLESTGLLPCAYTRNLLTPVLVDIEKNGMQLDREQVNAEYEEQATRLAELDLVKTLDYEINPNSPKQVAEYLYDHLGFAERRVKKQGAWVNDRTPAGGRKTGEDVVLSLKATTPKQRDFKQRYKAHAKVTSLLSKYLKKMKECCDTQGGVLYGKLNQMNTWTHRLSSSGRVFSLQFQNFRREYKKLFIPKREGWKICETDGSQLEFRVAIDLARDTQGFADLAAGIDAHAASAAVIGCSRQDAKAHTFKPLYGGRSGSKNEREYYEYFSNHYSDISNMQNQWIAESLVKKQLRTPWGLIFHWPDIRRSQDGYCNHTTSICNYPVQSFATSEIIPIALIYFWHKSLAHGLELEIVNTIHDSIICEVPDAELDIYLKLSRECMTDDVYRYVAEVYDYQIKVPLGCETKIGEQWSRGIEYKYEAPPELYKEAA